jgi:hypothetical protein
MEFIGEGGSLPVTGFAGVLAGIPRSVLALLAGILAGIPRSALALLACLLFPAAVIPLLRRRKEEKPVPRAGVRQRG